MPVVAAEGAPGQGKSTGILRHFQRFKGWKFYYTYPNKEKDINAFRAAGARVIFDFGEFLYTVLKHPGCLAAIDEADDMFPEDEPKAKQSWKNGRPTFIPHPTIQMLSTARESDIFLYVILHDIRGFRSWMHKYFHGLKRYQSNDNIEVQIRRFEGSWPQLVDNLKKHRKIKQYDCFFIPTPSYAKTLTEYHYISGRSEK